MNKTFKLQKLKKLIREEYNNVINEGKRKPLNETFTRQHYIAIANILKNANDKDEIVEALADLFASDNPRFQRDKFIRAAQ